MLNSHIQYSVLISRSMDLLTLGPIIKTIQDHGMRVRILHTHISAKDLENAIISYKINANSTYIELFKTGDASYKNDIIFICNPYLNQSVYEAIDNGKGKIVYIPYGTSISAETYTYKSHYDSHIHNKAWRIYVLNDFYLDLYKKHCTFKKGTNVRVIKSSPKFDYAIKNTQSASQNSTTKNFLLNINYEIYPQKEEKERTWSAFTTYRDILLQYFTLRSNINLIVRPHPSLFEKAEFWPLIQPFLKLKNVIMDDSRKNSYEVSFNMSDALITDRSSMIIDYIITKKPIIALHYERSRRINTFGAWLFDAFAYNAGTPDSLLQHIVMLTQGKDPKQEQRKQLLSNDELFDLSRPSSEIIFDDISSELPHTLQEAVA